MDELNAVKKRLSQIDSFFIAYQEHSNILMHFGAQLEFSGGLQKEKIQKMLHFLILKYPVLSSRVSKKMFGLEWKNTGAITGMMHSASKTNQLSAWRNKPLDPMNEPPFQVMHKSEKNISVLSFVLHHSAGDGELFIEIMYSAMEFLGDILSLKNPSNILPVENRTLSNVLFKDFKIFKKKKLRFLIRHLQYLKKMSKEDNSQRICARRHSPGDIDFIAKDLSKAVQKKIESHAKKKNQYLSAIYSAAWIKAIIRWNTLNGQKSGSNLVSLEIPVSLRKEAGGSYGNFISPLLVYANGKDSLDNISSCLQHELKKGMYRQLYLAMPFFTLGGMYIPWALYKKIAVTPLSTGFATSHFTLFHHSKSIEEIIEKASSGKIKINRVSLYTPVCLSMGAALSVHLWRNKPPGIHLTYRKTALSESDALKLLDLVFMELKRLN